MGSRRGSKLDRCTDLAISHSGRPLRSRAANSGVQAENLVSNATELHKARARAGQRFHIDLSQFPQRAVKVRPPFNLLLSVDLRC
jgi:hypothetical protein